jgi:AAA ATPase domain
MKSIDILVSTSEDVRKERSVAEKSIRSIAAELGVPVSVSYSGWVREPKQANKTSARPASDNPEDGLLLCPYFFEHQDSEVGPAYCEHILNPGQYDLIINILWSRLGTRSAQMFIMPDGSQPGSATEYETAWVLDQSKRTPGFPGLHVYWNRATPVAPLEPKEKREELCRQWDAVQEFCAAWEKNGETEFRECCHDYQDLEEFENLFREHFRDFLARRLDREIGSGEAPPKGRYLESNPFRGLNFFDFKHAALFHGRTKAVGEVLDALENQAAATKRFVLVVGPTGSGKSSLVRAGILPLLTKGNGLWRRAVTRPGAGDPFDALAAALFDKFALPELQEEESSVEWQNLAPRLRNDPDAAAARIVKVLDQLTRQELDQRESEGLPASRSEGLEVVRETSLGQVTPKMHLALVVDQLEELFAGGVSPVVQRKYISALGALAKSQRISIIVALRSGFYAYCQQFPEMVELTALGGTYELQPPTLRGIRNMIQFPAEAAGLRFERDPETGRSLDDALVEAAMASREPLPLLEHVLSRLYQKQLARKDGLLLWSDYRELGELQGALALHIKNLYPTLKRDQQQALRFVIRHLVESGRGEEDHLIRRTVLYRDLISSPELDQQQRAGAEGLVDRLTKEGLLSEANSKQGVLISVPQEAVLRRWLGVWQWLSEDRHFFQMRDRLDVSLKLWLSRNRQSDDLLYPGIGLAEAETLLRDYGTSLNERQIEYIQKSLARQKRHRWVRDSIGIAAIAGLAVFAAFAGIERLSKESRRKNSEQDVQVAQQNADLAANQRGALETQLKKAEEKAQLAQQDADLASSQRSALETQLKKAQEEKAQLAQQNSDLGTNQRSASETQLKKAENKAQVAQQNADLVANQRSALEAELKKAQEEKAQLAQQNANLTSQSSALETQLKKAEEKAQTEQQNSDQRSALETELKKVREEKAQLAQQNANLTSQSSVLEAQLKKAEEKAQTEQQNSDQRSALETELKKVREEKAQLAQQNANLTSQSSALETQLKKAEEEAQQAQQNSDQRSALEAELKKVREEKAQLAQQNANLTSQSSALETRLKKAEEEAQQAQQNSDQRSALEAELKKVREEKAQLAQQNANLTSQSSALETRLKKAEEEAQQAQQNSDQRSALEAELKKVREEKAQLEQQNANLTSQSSALETQLKKAEEKAQLEQTNVDLTGNQRTALEAQLKKAEEMVHQAQQNADVASSERDALQAELEKTREEKTQLELQNVDLTSSERSTSETQVNKAKGKGQQQTDLTTHKRKVQQTRSKKASSKATPKNRTKKHSTSAKTP